MFKWADGKSYAGNWEKGKMHGKGIFINKDGEESHGVWIEG